MADRRVVFASIEDAQIVRYERAKKWRVERDDGQWDALTVEGAAEMALDWADSLDGWVYLGLPGGQRFDRLIDQ